MDLDRAVLVHQARRSQLQGAADIVLAGDSSCLTGVSAPLLGELLNKKALNLGTLSYVDLQSQGGLLRQYTAANPRSPQTVVLLMHPEALRLQEAPAYYSAVLASCLGGRDCVYGSGIEAWLDRCLGLETFRGRFLGRWLPRPLTGAYAVRYGFTTDVRRCLDEHAGSLEDPNRYDASKAGGSPEYRLAARYELHSRLFREALPRQVRLAVGITPSPASFVSRQHSETCRAMLEQWGRWLDADLLLTALPTVLPDRFFASVTHLNAEGADHFTRLLAQQLSQGEAAGSARSLPR
jgi:hypothetical protein